MSTWVRRILDTFSIACLWFIIGIMHWQHGETDWLMYLAFSCCGLNLVGLVCTYLSEQPAK